MKAISLKQPWASMIANGSKTIETRTWPTKYRGDLLIVASRRPIINGLPTGQALCVVELFDCRPMKKEDEQAACCKMYEYGIGGFAWVLKNLRPVVPVDIRGTLGIYEVADELIEADCFNCNGCQDGCEVDGTCFYHEQRTMNNKTGHICRRCGKCCKDLSNSFWTNSEHPMIKAINKKLPDVYYKDHGSCDLLVIEASGRAVCLLQKWLGHAAKPKSCRDYPFDGKPCFGDET